MSEDEEEEKWRRNFLDQEEHLLTKGDDLQKLSVIGSLPELLKYDQKGTCTRIIPKIQQELPQSTSEFSLAVSRMFNILMHMDIPVNLVPQVLQGIEHRDAMISNAWMETLLSVIPLLKDEIVKKEILECAVSKSQLTRTGYFRVSSCKILGKLSIHRSMSSFEVKKDILPLVQSLCQDCFFEVRAAMCRELPNIAQGLYHLGDAVVKISLLPLLVELSADENANVRSVAIQSMVAIIPFLSPETVKGTIIPLAKKLCTKSTNDGDTTYIAISNVFKSLILNLQPQMTAVDATWFIDHFNVLRKKGLTLIEDFEADPAVCVLCRENCAISLAQLASMVRTLIPLEITGKWYQVFRYLAADPCYLVRKAVANCYSEIVTVLEEYNKIVVMDFTKLLRDEDEEVLQALVPKVSGILQQFAKQNVLQRDVTVQATLDVGRALLKCHNETFRTYNWRMKECLLVQWEHLPFCFPSDFIHQHFTPQVLWATLNGKAKPVRSQACRTLLIFLKYSMKEHHRKWIRDMIQLQLCNAKNCYTRQIYIILCTHAIDIFSWKYFKEHFYLALLNLAEDPVAVVRLSMVKLTPCMKHMLILPVDRGLQLKLENQLAKMDVMEMDRDVIMMVKEKIREMKTSRMVRNDVVMEDKRKTEEEERVFKGRMGPVRIPSRQDQATLSSSLIRPKPPPKLPLIDPTPFSSMPFFDQHFLTDAGIALPQDIKPKPSLEVSKLIQSAENLTNWLDELNITTENKRKSCSFDSAQPKKLTTLLKRRSLNISNLESRIPVYRTLAQQGRSKSFTAGLIHKAQGVEGTTTTTTKRPPPKF